MRVAVPITVTPEERATLERWARGRRTPARVVLRAQIVLHAAAGQRHDEIAQALDTDREWGGRWRTRFAQQGLAGSGTPRAPAERPPSRRRCCSAASP